MKRLFLYGPFYVLLLVINLSCGANILSEFTSETDESRLFQAKQHMSKSEWDKAIEAFDKMSADFLGKREVIIQRAKAYAGRCGLNLLDMAENLAEPGSASLMGLLMTAMTGATTAEANDCITAEALIKTISADAAERTNEENITMAFIEFAKIGAILASRADPDGDGTPDWGNDDSCTVGSGSDDFLTDLEAQHIATGLANMIVSLNATSSGIGGAQLSAMDAICTAIDGSPFDFCDDLDVADVDANNILGIRSVVQEGQDGIGIGTCTDAPPNLMNCVCP